MPFIRCHDGLRLHHAERGRERAGAARPPALLIHGAGASSAIWLMVMSRLASVTRAVAIDLPGHGPSPKLPETATLAAYADAVGALGAALGLPRSVLVGHSMGALLAIEAAARWPDKVAGLVLCGAAPQLPVTEELLAAIDDYPRFSTWLAERGLSPWASSAVRRGFIAAGLTTAQEVTRADFLACRGIDLTARLAEVKAPIVWLDGQDDRLVSPVAHRPGQVRTLTGVGHMIPLEAAAAVAEAAGHVVGQG